MATCLSRCWRWGISTSSITTRRDAASHDRTCIYTILDYATVPTQVAFIIHHVDFFLKAIFYPLPSWKEPLNRPEKNRSLCMRSSFRLSLIGLMKIRDEEIERRLQIGSLRHEKEEIYFISTSCPLLHSAQSVVRDRYIHFQRKTTKSRCHYYYILSLTKLILFYLFIDVWLAACYIISYFFLSFSMDNKQ